MAPFPSTEYFWAYIRQSVSNTSYLVFVPCVFNLPVAQKEGDRNSNNLYGLFDDALNNAGYITSRIVWLEKVLKGTVVALVKYNIFLRNVCVCEAAGNAGRDSPCHWFISRREFSPYDCRELVFSSLVLGWALKYFKSDVFSFSFLSLGLKTWELLP